MHVLDGSELMTQLLSQIGMKHGLQVRNELQRIKITANGLNGVGEGEQPTLRPLRGPPAGQTTDGRNAGIAPKSTERARLSATVAHRGRGADARVRVEWLDNQIKGSRGNASNASDACGIQLVKGARMRRDGPKHIARTRIITAAALMGAALNLGQGTKYTGRIGTSSMGSCCTTSL